MEDQSITDSGLSAKATPRIINIRPLKQFAVEKLRAHSVLRDVLLAEKDEMSSVEFVAKMQTWLFLVQRQEE